MSTDERDPPSYDVGYKKPPVHTRFAKGTSGNPSGRPKRGTLSVRRSLESVLEKSVRLTLDGKKTAMRLGDALFMSVLLGAIKGDKPSMNAAMKLVELTIKLEPPDPPPQTKIVVEYVEPKPQNPLDED